MVAVHPLERRLLLSHSPVGPDLTIATASDTGASSTAMAPDGSCVVTWSAGTAGAGTGLDVFGRLYDPAGVPKGEAFRLNVAAEGDQNRPSVAMDADGDFVVAWVTQEVTGGEPGLYFRLFNADGSARGGQTLVERYYGSRHEVAMAPSGAFVVGWEQHFRLYTAGGDAGARVFYSGNNFWSFGGIAMDAGGNVTVNWADFSYGRVRRFNAAGDPITDVVTVPRPTPGGGEVACDEAGNFAVSWLEPTGTDLYTLHLRRYDAAAVARGSAVFVASGVVAGPTPLAVDVGGDFAVAFAVRTGHTATAVQVVSYGGDGVRRARWDIPGQVDAPGGGVGPSGGNRARPSLAMSSEGDFVVVCTGGAEAGNALLARRFAAFDDPVSVSGTVWIDADVDGVRDVAEGSAPSVTVGLFNEFGLAVATQTTNAQGRYTFAAMPGQPLYVRVTPPTRYLLAARDVGGDENADSDVDGSTGRSDVFSVPAGQAKTGIDAGIVAGATVTGVVFNDYDRSVARDVGEPAIPGWLVYLDRNGNAVPDVDEPTSTTDANGVYYFDTLWPGDYTLAAAAQDSWEGPAPQRLTLAGGETTIHLPAWTTRQALPARSRGGQTLVSSTFGSNAVVAADAAGNHIVVWAAQETGGADTSGPGIYARRYAPSGDALGGRFLVNTLTQGTQELPSVAMSRGGDCVITWYDRTTGGVHARSFDASGTARGPAFRVDHLGVTWGSGAQIAMDATGAFLVMWGVRRGGEVDSYARKYSPTGAELGDPFLLPTPAGSLVAADAAGNLLVAWQAQASDGTHDVVARRLDAVGAPKGPAFVVNTYTKGDQWFPSVTMNPAGEAVIVWFGEGPVSSTSGLVSKALFAQRLDAAGGRRGEVAVVSTGAAGGSSVAMDDAGHYVVAWPSNNARQVWARKFTAGGSPVGPFAVVTEPDFTYSLARAFVATDGGGDFIVAYDASRTFPSAGGTYVRRYTTPPQTLTHRFEPAGADPAGAPAQRLIVRFSEDVGASLAAGDLTLTHRATGETVPPERIALQYNGAEHAATFTFPGYPGGVLPDGDYRATLRAADVTDAAGNALAGDYSVDFFALTGDINRDRAVNGSDFALLAQNFGRTGRTYGEGDLNGDGAVNGSDFALLAANFGRTVPAQANPAPAQALAQAPAPAISAAVSAPAPVASPAAKRASRRPKPPKVIAPPRQHPRRPALRR